MNGYRKNAIATTTKKHLSNFSYVLLTAWKASNLYSDSLIFFSKKYRRFTPNKINIKIHLLAVSNKIYTIIF